MTIGLQSIYSIGALLGGGGIGYTAHRATEGLYHAGILSALFVSSNAQTSIPSRLIRHWGLLGRAFKYLGFRDRSGLIYYLESLLFDAWVSLQLPAGDIFHGWNGFSLQSLQRAKARGMITVVECASAHPTVQRTLLEPEYQRWGVPWHVPRWNYGRVLRELALADYITIPSAFVRESMSAQGFPLSKLIEIPFGVDLAKFSPSPSPKTGRPVRFIFAGQVSIRKGVPYLLEAWKRLKLPDSELWLSGGVTSDFAAIRHRWANVEGIRFLGYSSMLPTVFQQCDVFVFPTIEEGSALVTYEALASSLPVITTPNAGSIVRDGQEGYIVPVRDIDALCERMERLWESSLLREAMAHAARHRAEQYGWDRYQRDLADAYRVIARKAP
jgi:glycosyltransferase involved in cell wall biosynthesis